MVRIEKIWLANGQKQNEIKCSKMMEKPEMEQYRKHLSDVLSRRYKMAVSVLFMYREIEKTLINK